MLKTSYIKFSQIPTKSAQIPESTVNDNVATSCCHIQNYDPRSAIARQSSSSSRAGSSWSPWVQVQVPYLSAIFSVASQLEEGGGVCLVRTGITTWRGGVIWVEASEQVHKCKSKLVFFKAGDSRIFVGG